MDLPSYLAGRPLDIRKPPTKEEANEMLMLAEEMKKRKPEELPPIHDFQGNSYPSFKDYLERPKSLMELLAQWGLTNVGY